MLKAIKAYSPSEKIVVRDSLDDEISDDVEDDVFIRDGKSARLIEENGLKKPLMPPRRKMHKGKSIIPIMRKRHSACWRCCEPFCYGLAALMILLALLILAAMLITIFPTPLHSWFKKEPTTVPYGTTKVKEIPSQTGEIVPCTRLSVRKLWTKSIPRITSESPMRKTDVNGDGIDDIVIGFGIDDTIPMNPSITPKCEIQSTGQMLDCRGGVTALNGINGESLWTRWVPFNIFSLFCSVDLNRDNRTDCVATGRGKLIVAINGINGNIIWEYASNAIHPEHLFSSVIDFYTINPIDDLNDDEILDIVAMHVEEQEKTYTGYIEIISGATGNLIRQILTPHDEEVFAPLLKVTQQDGTDGLLLITGGQSTPGGIYFISLRSLIKDMLQPRFTKILHQSNSGFMAPAILSDVNGDLTEDYIVASFNSTVYAIDGRTHQIIWKYEFNNSESVSSIVPGMYNGDNVTDFMVKYNTGPGYPVYYYSQTAILNGIDGTNLLTQMITDAGGPNGLLAGLSLSQDFNEDYFLHWQTQCQGVSVATDSYQFIPDSNVILQSKADVCRLRYNTSSILKLYAIARHVEPPGAVLFSNEDLSVKLNKTKVFKIDTPPQIRDYPKVIKKIDNGDQQRNNTRKNIMQKSRQLKYQNGQLEDDSRNTGIGSDLLGRPEHLPPRRWRNKHPQYQQSNIYRELLNNPYDINYNEMNDDENPLNSLPEDYDSVLQDPRIMETRYLTNRQVQRVKNELKDSDENQTRQLINTDNLGDVNILLDYAKGTDDEAQKETLWDIERENEETDGQRVAKLQEYINRSRRSTTADLDNILPTLTSTGVLVSSMEQDDSGIDYVFALNFRESIDFPPLLTSDDLGCVEKKLSEFKQFTHNELLIIERRFLNECLKIRIGKLPETIEPTLESQVVVVRLTISCTCGQLNSKETCSKIRPVDQQKWTQFMGSRGDGIY